VPAPPVHDQHPAAGDAGRVQVELGGVQLHVAEPVGRRDPGADRPRRHHRPGHVQALQGRGIDRGAEIGQGPAGGQMGGGGSEDVPAVERARHGSQHDVRALDLHGLVDPAERVPREGQHAVVGTDQEGRTRARGQRPPVRPHARVDDRDVDGVRRHVGNGARELDGSAEHVLTRDRVRQIDHANVRRDPSHHAVADAHERVPPPVVGEEDDRPRHDSTGR
jgi:hypothetical protein